MGPGRGFSLAAPLGGVPAVRPGRVRAAQSCSGPGTGGNRSVSKKLFAYALTELTAAAAEARVGALVRKAVS